MKSLIDILELSEQEIMELVNTAGDIIDNPADSGSLYDFPSLTDLSVADALSWTPFGAAFQLPYDLLTGNPLLFVARLAILAVTWVVCFVGCVWCLRHDRVTAGAPERAAKVRGIGAFGWMPDSTLKPRAQGRESRKTRTKLTVTAFLRVHLSTSMP